MGVSMPIYVRPGAARLANLWHGGQSSGLYSLGSTWQIHSEEHRQRCLKEIDDTIRDVEKSDSTFFQKSIDINQLNTLRRFLVDAGDFIE